MRFSLIFGLYLVRQFLKAFGGALGIIMGIIYLFDVVELLRRAATHGDASFPALLGLGALQVPQMAETVLPFAVLIGAMQCLYTLSRSRELVVARAAGISVWEFLAPVALVAMLIGVFEVTVFNPFSAALYRTYEQQEDQLALRNPTNPLLFGESGLHLREVQGDNLVWIQAQAVRQEGYALKLRGVSVIVTDQNNKLLYRDEAALADLSDGAFHLTDVAVMRPGAAVRHEATLDIPTQLTLARIQNNFASPESLSFWELPGFIRFFEGAGFSAVKQRMYFQSLLAMPLLLCAMMLLAAVFSLSPNLRSGGVATRVAAATASGFVLYFFTRVVYALGMSATLPPAMAAWSPAVVVLLIGLGALFHLEDG